MPGAAADGHFSDGLLTCAGQRVVAGAMELQRMMLQDVAAALDAVNTPSMLALAHRQVLAGEGGPTLSLCSLPLGNPQK